MNAAEQTELVKILSSMMRVIHELPATDVRVVMDADEHMRSDTLSEMDLTHLREIQKRRNGASK